MFPYVSLCSSGNVLVGEEALIPWSWSRRWLYTCLKWVGTEPWSSEGTARALSHSSSLYALSILLIILFSSLSGIFYRLSH